MAVIQQHAAPALASLLSGCSQALPTGVHELERRVPVSFHLLDGALTYAECPDVPGLGARLVSAGRMSWQDWTALRARAVDSGVGAGHLLVAGGATTAAEVRELVEATIRDVLLHLLLDGEESWERRAAPAPWRSSWVGDVVRLEIGEAVEQAARTADAATRLGLSPAHVLVPAVAPSSAVVVSDAAWAVLWQLDGRRTLRDLAWATGLPATVVVPAVGHLVGSGLCTLLLPATPAQQSGTPRLPRPVPAMEATSAGAARGPEPAPSTAPSAHPDAPVDGAVTAGPAVDRLPRRQRQGRPWDLTPAPGRTGRPGVDDVPPVESVTPEVLRRVIARLQELP